MKLPRPNQLPVLLWFQHCWTPLFGWFLCQFFLAGILQKDTLLSEFRLTHSEHLRRQPDVFGIFGSAKEHMPRWDAVAQSPDRILLSLCCQANCSQQLVANHTFAKCWTRLSQVLVAGSLACRPWFFRENEIRSGILRSQMHLLFSMETYNIGILGIRHHSRRGRSGPRGRPLATRSCYMWQVHCFLLSIRDRTKRFQRVPTWSPNKVLVLKHAALSSWVPVCSFLPPRSLDYVKKLLQNICHWLSGNYSHYSELYTSM